MSSYRQILYHIIFRTKRNERTLALDHSRKLYAYIYGIIKSKKCKLYRINGMEDHIHILSDLHPTIALADFVRDIKTASSVWLKNQNNFYAFKGWADGYAGLTYAYRDKEMIMNYIINQRIHHKKMSFEDEYRSLLVEHGITLNERYFLK